MNKENKRRYTFLIAGILCLVISFVWMIAMQTSAGPFLILASVGGALLASTKSKGRKK